MSREIKFRQFAKGKMFYWGFNVAGDGSYFTGPVSGGGVIPGASNQMQFTGLRDANGVEIYEGDILHWAGDDKSLKEPFTCAVKYFEECAKFDLDSDYEDDVSWWAGKCLVIGNAFEHPHLLDEAK